MNDVMDKLIKELYDEWQIDSHLTEPEYIKFTKDTYQILIEKAKSGKMIFYGELPAFNQLKERFKDAAPQLIGSVVGACSEYEATKGRPLVSAIVLSRDTSEPGRGFYSLSTVPYNLCMDTWEQQDIEPPEVVINKRHEFWLSELQATLEYWAKHDT